MRTRAGYQKSKAQEDKIAGQETREEIDMEEHGGTRAMKEMETFEWI